MTTHIDQDGAATVPAADAAEWDLDITIAESAAVVTEAVQRTSDGCGNTCETACTSCP